MKRTVFSLIILLAQLSAYSQQVRPSPSSDILSQLRQLHTLGTVMYLAAHPDDENTRLISYLVHERNVRTIYLSLTRGDGGQNIIGSEQGPVLGLIRTLEMNEARKLDGAEQLYTSAIDFGFTKNPEEVFTFWNKQQLVNEVKNAIQKTRPDIIILRFPTTGEGGHGQHTASAIIALEAYKQLSEEARTNKLVWLPRRVLFNAFNFGDRSTQREDQLKIDINQYNPLLGKSYGELAGQSRSMHKSQGAGTPQSFGIYKEYFQHLAGTEATGDILEGTDLTWNRIGAGDIGQEIAAVIKQFEPEHPGKSVPDLLRIRDRIVRLPAGHYRDLSLGNIDRLILSCTGITAEILAEKPAYVPGEPIHGTLNIIARYEDAGILSVQQDTGTLHTAIVTTPLQHTFEKDKVFRQELTFVNHWQPDQPYWLGSEKQHHFTAISVSPLGIPVQPAKQAQVLLEIDGHRLTVHVPLSYKRLDPLRGDVINAIRIEPALSVTPFNSLLFVYKDSAATQLQLKANTTLSDIRIAAGNAPGKPAQQILHIGQLKAGTDTLITCPVPPGLLKSGKLYFTANASGTDAVFHQGQKLLTYEHIPEIQYLETAVQKIVHRSWESKVKKIGYIQGADDLVDDVLKSLGLDVINLSLNDFQTPAFIQDLDAIVVGIRAYNVNNDIAAIHPLLMQYAAGGGTVIVQYNTDKNLKTDLPGPYPLTLSRNRITREDAPTQYIRPQHRLLHYPNTINKGDWDNWVQERGLYYARQWDDRYQTVISHQEFEEKQQESGILYAPYGKGHYIYTSLAFFRQLPDGNAGAIKLFMNMLSVGK